MIGSLLLPTITSFLLICRHSLSIFQLNETNFDAVTKASTGENKDWLVRFYAPWCPYSREMLPALENAESQLMGFVHVGEVDAIANRKLSLRFNITGFPTVKLFHKGKSFTFQGRRSADELTEFALRGYVIHSPEAVPAPFGYFFGEALHLYRLACRNSIHDLRTGKYLTVDVILALLPYILFLLLCIVCCIPFSSIPAEDDDVIIESRKSFPSKKMN